MLINGDCGLGVGGGCGMGCCVDKLFPTRAESGVPSLKPAVPVPAIVMTRLLAGSSFLI